MTWQRGTPWLDEKALKVGYRSLVIGDSSFPASPLKEELVLRDLLSAAIYPPERFHFSVGPQGDRASMNVRGFLRIDPDPADEIESQFGWRGFAKLHARLISHRAVMRGDEFTFLDVIHGDHLVVRAWKERLHHHAPAGGDFVDHLR